MRFSTTGFVKLWLILAALGLSPAIGLAQTPRLVAVLPLDLRQANIDDATRIALEESIRTVAGDTLYPLGFTVLTGENTLAVLSENGIDPDQACEAECALEAAREINAEYFISGTVVHTEGFYSAFIRLFESQTGRQLGYVALEGETVRQVRIDFAENAENFFNRLLDPEGRGRPQQTASPASPVTPPPVAQQPTVPAQPRPVIPRPEPLHQPAQAAVSWLNISSEPAGAELFLDGRSIGRSPLANHPVAPGHHVISVDGTCFLPHREELVLAPTEVWTRHLSLNPNTTPVQIQPQDPYGSPIQGTVFIDEKQAGTAPGTFHIPLCARQIRVSSPQGFWVGELDLRRHRVDTIAAMVSPRGANVGLVRSNSTAPASKGIVASGAKPKSAKRNNAFRAGVGAASGWLGASYEYRSSTTGFIMGFGFPSFTAGLVYGSSLNDGGLYITTVAVLQYLAPYTLDGVYGYSGYYDYWDNEIEIGFASTIGWDIRIGERVSIKLGAGAYINDRANVLPVVDAELGLLF